MAYEFDADESVATAVARIAHEQLDEARGHLDAAEAATGGDRPGRPGDDPVEDTVHRTRKCCKRLRGLVRLVRPALGDTYTVANRGARDAARELSAIRDAHALLATFDDLAAARADQVPDGGLGPLRRRLVADAEEATATLVAETGRLGRAREHLDAAADALGASPLAEADHDDQLDAVVDGIARTAGRARDRFAEVAATDGTPGDELLHQWRKRVKYAWYHVSLLEPAAPTLLGAHADLLHDLSDVLGDDHDLAVLADALRAGPDAHGGDRVIDPALVLLDGTRRDLQRRAVAVGARLHAEDPEATGRRLVALLSSWWTHGPERPAGEIADLYPADDELGDRTAGQLRDLAREVALPGRSDMDRATLLAALRAAGAA